MASNMNQKPIIQKPDTIKSARFKRFIRAKFLLNHLKAFPKNQKTLDLGAGWGISLLVNPNFYCCELDKACFEYLKSQSKRVESAAASDRLPYEDNFFDNVFTHDYLEHLDNNELHSTFKEVRRVLKPGGIFLNVVPHRRGYDYGIFIDNGHKTFITIDIIEELGRSYNFKVLKSWTSPLPKFIQNFYVHNKLCVKQQLIN